MQRPVTDVRVDGSTDVMELFTPERENPGRGEAVGRCEQGSDAGIEGDGVERVVGVWQSESS